MQDIGGLPDHMQLMVVGSVIVISSVWGVVKFIKPFIDNLAPKAKAQGQSTDAVIISAALADGKLMAELTRSVDMLRESQEKSNAIHDRGNVINQMLMEAVTRLVLKQ